MCPNSLSDLNEIWNQDILGDDASLEEKFPFWEIGPGIFKFYSAFASESYTCTHVIFFSNGVLCRIMSLEV